MKVKKCFAPSTALFRAGSRDAGSVARQTERPSEAAAVSSPVLSASSFALSEELLSLLPVLAESPQATTDRAIVPASRSAKNFFIFINISPFKVTFFGTPGVFRTLRHYRNPRRFRRRSRDFPLRLYLRNDGKPACLFSSSFLKPILTDRNCSGHTTPE